MALTTRCPVCGTLFKVVPDQLRISEGWVRCGQCAEVFDAASDLQKDGAEEQGTKVLVPLSEDVSHPAILAAEPAWQLEPSAAAIVESQSAPSDLPEQNEQLPDTIETPALDFLLAPLKLSDAVPTPAWQEDSDIHPSILEFEPILAAEEADFSFTREPLSARTAVPHAVARGLWIAAGVLLLLVMGLQAIFFGRDTLAATWPDARPLLQAACAHMGCTVQALRNIEAIVIDSSTLSALQNEDAFRLNLVLKNQEKLDLAMPAIEFVFTDIDEQEIFRRVLTPAELGAASRVLFAGREWSTSVDLRVIDGPKKDRIVGYRLLAFYP